MADSRMVGNAIRRRMGAASSHLGQAEAAKKSEPVASTANPDPSARLAAIHELRRLSAD